MKLIATSFAAVLLMLGAGGVAADPDKDESGRGRDNDRTRREEREPDRDRRSFESRKEGRRGGEDRSRGAESYFRDRGYARLDIPRGHYPPPGECRVWFPDRPPGQQPPPGGCRNVPPGAWAIRHPADRPDHVHIDAYDAQVPGLIEAIGEFDIASGGFVRILLGQ